MAQHDYDIANASFPTVRTDINNVLSAINTCNSGSSRPSSAVAGTIWLDTSGDVTAHLLKFYDGAADILLATINTTANTVDWADSSVDTVTFKQEGTNFTGSLLLGHSTTGTLNAAQYNTGVGLATLDALTSGDLNTAVGSGAGSAMTTGSGNTFIGMNAGETTIDSQNNTAVGSNALGDGDAGNNNTAVGKDAGQNITGAKNIVLGVDSGDNITSGDGNVVIGKADVSSATGDQQLSISDGDDGSVVWITGDSSGNISNGSTAINIAGKQTIWVPANAMTPTTSNGCAAIATVETTSGRPDLNVLDFDDGADEHAQFSVAFPKSWNLGTITFQVFWTSTATDTDGVSWGLQGVGMADNETQDVAYGTAIVVDDACQSAAEELYVTAESSAVTIAGTPADDDLTYFRIFRDVSDANDTAAEDARLIGVKIFYTTDAKNDA